MLFYHYVYEKAKVADSQLFFRNLLFGQSLCHLLVLCDNVYTDTFRKDIKVQKHMTERRQQWIRKITN